MPTELEIMKHAKEYIDKLANGIDPFSDKPVPDGDIINNVKLSRCFFYISGILEKVIENGGEVAKPQVTEAVRPHKRGNNRRAMGKIQMFYKRSVAVNLYRYDKQAY